jgi:hypothetical protein
VRRWRHWRAPALGAICIGLLGRLIGGPLPLNYYDTAYALLWGRQIDHGQLPSYQTAGASTPHPLATAVGAVVALLGTQWSWRAIELIVLLAFGVLGVALYMLVKAVCASRTAGVIAALVLLASPPFLSNGLGGSGLADLPPAALVLAAAALEARRPRRGDAPLVLLALAGLLRPEAWGLSAIYWCWLAYARPGWRALVRYVAIALAAPLLWLASDLIITGSATYSLSHTQTGVQQELRNSSLAHAPGAAYRGLRALLGLPVLVVGAVGAVIALLRSRRAAAILLVLAALCAVDFLALGALHLPLIKRYLLVFAAIVAAFFAYAVTVGRRELRSLAVGRVPLLRTSALIAAIVIVGYAAISDAHGLSHVRSEQHAAVTAESNLIALAPRADRLLASCRPLIVPGIDLVPLAAYDFDLAPAKIERLHSGVPTDGLVLVPLTSPSARYFGLGAKRLRRTRNELQGAGFAVIASDESWQLLARCGRYAGLRAFSW